ncbi:serine beta-lactamase-like protein LACTB, mitochondrial isoform X2 [Portunus trituberculatus]|uniref:serine beta-lactamase-like protein LACTB, mitochondrial isoform X2 n=1 Tax=Portunus trituberculatus TaxID=210409 RepID=UPI001E1CCE2B|nr:serine beta-lactamase-like protein LACTB, mitochondrial isoform X2 [Portunus trituberculatus]
MLRTVFHQGLSRCVPHPHHSQLLRFSSIAIRKDKHCLVPSSSTSLPNGHVQKSHRQYSTDHPNNSRLEYTGSTNSQQYNKPLGKLLGAIGTVAVLGFGTILSKSKEEKGSCDGEGDHPLVEICVNNEEAEVGKDVVGTKRSHKCGEAIVIPQTRPHVEPCDEKLSRHEQTVKKARQILRRFAEEVGAPGLVVGVTVNGKQVWMDGFGFADLENGVRCSPATVMRIASISKSLTMTAVAKLWEDGKLDLDDPIQKYIPDFPKKTYNGEEVTITIRQLLSHKSGIRHYKLYDPQKKNDKKKGCAQRNDDSKIESQTSSDKEKEAPADSTENDKMAKQVESLKEKAGVSTESEAKKEKVVVTISGENETASCSKDVKQEESKNKITRCLCGNRVLRRKNKKKKDEEEDEFDLKEYYIKEEFETIKDALKLFQDDELFFKPGEGYLYTTHGWTVVSAVVEAAAQQPFIEVMGRLFYELGLSNTYLDVALPIIHNRASYYVRDMHGRLKNAPYVDNSYKWAGGGFLSTVGDLCKFGNAMLYSSQQESKDTARLPGYLKASTVQQLWAPVNGTKHKDWMDGAYGMGWTTVADRQLHAFGRKSRRHALHTGGAVGASSVLLVLPQEPNGDVPQGVVVALLANMQGVSMSKVALEVAELFEKNSVKCSS